MILKRIENELVSRSTRSEWISCPSFLPVIQSFVSPSKENRRSSHSKYPSKQRKSVSSSSVKNCVYGSSGDDRTCCYVRGGVSGSVTPREYGVSSSPLVKRESDLDGLTPMTSSPSACDGDPSCVNRKHPPVSSLHYVSPPSAYCRAIEVMIRVGSSGMHTEGELIRCCEEYMKKENGRVSEVGECVE